MNNNRLCKDIKDEYKPHGVKLDILGVEFIERYERVILEVELKKGTTIKRFFARAPEVRHALHLELFYPFQEGTKLYIAVSDRKDITVNLTRVLRKSLPDIRCMKAPYAVGETIRGKPYLVDICTLPHLIIAGASNTGKSAALRSLILSTVCNRSVDDVIFFLIDTGANSLSVFENLSHLGYRIVKGKMEAAQIFLFLETLLNERVADADYAPRIFPVVVCVVDESTSLIRGITGNEELCRIILWALGQEQISRSEIMKTFHMSKRANEIFRKLVELGIVDDKQTNNQPSAVIPRCVEDMPHEAMIFLRDNGISMCDIEEAVRDKPETNFDCSDLESGLSEPVFLSDHHPQKANRPSMLKLYAANADKRPNKLNTTFTQKYRR